MVLIGRVGVFRRLLVWFDDSRSHRTLVGGSEADSRSYSERLRAGLAYLPRNTVHAFKGASPSPARVLIFAAPAHSSAFFEDVNREVRKLPDDLAAIPSIGQRHGIEFLPASGPAA